MIAARSLALFWTDRHPHSRMSLRLAVLAATSVLGGILAGGAFAVEPVEHITITSPSSIADVSSDGTPGATITGEAAYSPVRPASRASAVTADEWSMVSVDGKAVCVDGRSATGNDCTYQQIVMDFAETGGRFAGSWAFFVPAAMFSPSIDGWHTFAVELHVIGPDELYRLVGSDSKRIQVEPPPPTGRSTTTSQEPGPSPSAVTAQPTGTPAAAPGAQPPPDHTASRLRTGRAEADSVYSALTPVQQLHPTMTSVVVLVVVTLVLLLLIGFPGVLIESTVSKHYDELFPWVKRRRAKEADPRTPARVATWITVTLGVALASIVSGFVDPQFGFNLGSARLLLSSAAVFIVVSVLGWLAVERVIHFTDPALRPVVEFKWLSLVIVALAVLLSRSTGFEPGIVFGLVVGLSFGATLSTAQSARTVLVGVAYAFTLGLGCWLAYSALKALLEGAPSVGSEFALDLLAGIAVAGMSTLPVALLPITGLGGAAVFAWSRWVWAVVYAAGLATFFLVLMPLPQAWGEVSLALRVWVLLYACFAVGAILFWAFFRIKDGPPAIDARRHAR